MRWRSGPASSTLPAGRGVSNQLTLKLLALAILVAASAVLTGAEAAYFSLGRARLRKLTGSTSEARSPLIERPHDLLVTLLVGITVINIGAAALAATLAEDVFGVRYGLLVEIIGMILILTTFGEVLPMTFAVKCHEQFLPLARGRVAWLSFILKPVRSTLGALTTLTVHLIGSERQAAQPELSEEELRTLVDVGAKEGVVEREEREMIHKVFELEDTLVRSVMVPRTDMFCLDLDTPSDQILPALRENLHSRVPVYEGSIDVIVGILYTKALLAYLDGLPADFDLRTQLHPPYFVKRMPTMTSMEPSYTGTRECRFSRSAGRIWSLGVSRSRQNMSVRGTMTERTSVSSSSKTLWIISRSSRSTTPSLAPTSTSVRRSSSLSSGWAAWRSLPMRCTVSVVRALRVERTGLRMTLSQATGPRASVRNCSGDLTAKVMGRTSPKVAKIRIIPMISTRRP